MNVVIPDENPKKLGYQLRNRINTHEGSLITVCPNYNRVKLKAVCIEIKNLNIDCLIPENLEEMSQIIKNLD